MQNDIDTLIVIDFETLGTDVDTCPVMALGVVIGDTKGRVYREKEFIFPLAEQFNLHFIDADEDTVQWWSTPDKEDMFKDYLHKCMATNQSIKSTISDINDFIFAGATVNSSLVVANSPDFDCRILKNLYEMSEVRWPFTFRQEFDFRSARNLFKMAGIDIDAPATNKHNALADAQWEYEMVCKYINYLRRSDAHASSVKPA